MTGTGGTPRAATCGQPADLRARRRPPHRPDGRQQEHRGRRDRIEHDGPRRCAILTAVHPGPAACRACAGVVPRRRGPAWDPVLSVTPGIRYRLPAGDGRRFLLLSRVGRMDFSPSPRAAELHELVSAFVRDEIEPVAAEYHRHVTQGPQPTASGPSRRSSASCDARRAPRDSGTSSCRPSTGTTTPGSSAPSAAPACRTATTPRWPSRWAGCLLAPYVFNCTPPTPATWRCCSIRHRRAAGASGSSRCWTAGSARRSR